MILETYAHSEDARHDFLDVISGPNHMTPEHIKTIYINNFAVEITKGKWINNTIYGFTVVNTITNKVEDDLSSACWSEKEIKDRITVLKRVRS